MQFALYSAHICTVLDAFYLSSQVMGYLTAKFCATQFFSLTKNFIQNYTLLRQVFNFILNSKLRQFIATSIGIRFQNAQL